MSDPSREFQFGQHLYEVRVSKSVHSKKALYVKADTITVHRSGALILNANLKHIEPDEDDLDEGIVLPLGLIVATGQWFSALEVTADEGHLPMYFEGGYFDQMLTDK